MLNEKEMKEYLKGIEKHLIALIELAEPYDKELITHFPIINAFAYILMADPTIQLKFLRMSGEFLVNNDIIPPINKG